MPEDCISWQHGPPQGYGRLTLHIKCKLFMLARAKANTKFLKLSNDTTTAPYEAKVLRIMSIVPKIQGLDKKGNRRRDGRVTSAHHKLSAAGGEM